MIFGDPACCDCRALTSGNCGRHGDVGVVKRVVSGILGHVRTLACTDRHCDCCDEDTRDTSAGLKILCSGCGRYLCDACGRGCRHERTEHFHRP